MKRKQTLMAIAVASGSVSWTYLIDGKLRDWGTFRKSVGERDEARKAIRWTLARYQPDVIVTENPSIGCAKSDASLQVLQAIAQDAEDAPGLHVRVPRVLRHDNKLEEAAAMGRRFPEIAPWVPKKLPNYKREQRRLTVFEALALACEILEERGDEKAWP